LFQAKGRNLVLKLVRCRDEEREHYGVLINNEVLFLPRLAKRLNEKLPELLEEFIALGKKGVETAEITWKSYGKRC